MLSLYHDEELPVPWKEKLEAHLADCPLCRERLEGFRCLSGILSEGADFPIEPVQDRVWRRLRNPAFAVPRSWPQPIWNRSIRVPLPLACAVAALVLVFGVFLARASRPAEGAGMALSTLDVQTVVPVTDLSGILQYLGDDDSGDIVIIRLPESRSFTSFGEPAIIRAADYGGGKGR
jgi:anti-sigma factor RsiW